MPEWSDTGLLLSVRKYGEYDAVATLLTSSHGRQSGLCRAAFSRKKSGMFQTGNLLQASWKARLDEQLGVLSCDLMTPYAAQVMSDPDRLTVLSCICALSGLLPEREPVPDFFQKTLEQIVLLSFDGWAERYVRWELDLLEVLGFGLDLSACAVTGRTDALAYVSPKSGRAVCAEAGAPWRERLLILPSFLRHPGAGAQSAEEIKNALNLTGFFLENHAAKTVDCRIPAVRSRLVARFAGTRL